jgi:hypothetical protein
MRRGKIHFSVILTVTAESGELLGNRRDSGVYDPNNKLGVVPHRNMTDSREPGQPGAWDVRASRRTVALVGHHAVWAAPCDMHGNRAEVGGGLDPSASIVRNSGRPRLKERASASNSETWSVDSRSP